MLVGPQPPRVVCGECHEVSSVTQDVTGAIDCDMHPRLPTPKALRAHMDEFWRDTVATVDDSGVVLSFRFYDVTRTVKVGSERLAATVRRFTLTEQDRQPDQFLYDATGGVIVQQGRPGSYQRLSPGANLGDVDLVLAYLWSAPSHWYSFQLSQLDLDQGLSEKSLARAVKAESGR